MSTTKSIYLYLCWVMERKNVSEFVLLPHSHCKYQNTEFKFLPNYILPFSVHLKLSSLTKLCSGAEVFLISISTGCPSACQQSLLYLGAQLLLCHILFTPGTKAMFDLVVEKPERHSQKHTIHYRRKEDRSHFVAERKQHLLELRCMEHNKQASVGTKIIYWRKVRSGLSG